VSSVCGTRFLEHFQRLSRRVIPVELISPLDGPLFQPLSQGGILKDITQVIDEPLVVGCKILIFGGAPIFC
jgi:hypothetical protein